MNIDEIQQIFFQECEEGLATMEASFATIRDGLHDAETINTIFRSVHSIKGGAGAFGHNRLQAFTHHYETLLDLIRTGEIALAPPLLATIVGAFDILADHVEAARDSLAAPADDEMLSRLEHAARSPLDECHHDIAAAIPTIGVIAPAAAGSMEEVDELVATFDAASSRTDAVPVPAPWMLTMKPVARAFENGAEPLLLLRELELMGAKIVSVDDAELPDLHDLDTEISHLAWKAVIPGHVGEDEIAGVFEFAVMGEFHLVRAASDIAASVQDSVLEIEDKAMAISPCDTPAATEDHPVMPAGEADPQVAAARSQPVAVTQTIRVDLDKLDRLVNLVGELVITQSMLAQRLSEHNLTAITELTDLDHLTRELQDSTMAIRAQPMKTVFSRVPRIIRELEVETGKHVRLEVEGEMTEVDKTVVERIGEPLTHLIRNAVDHGIEPSDERIAIGKTAEGVVRLSAAHQSGRIVITISDDGRGIDRKRVREKAIEKQIVSADVQLSDEEIDNLIFAPGFSTAATLSNISGRGVGMDVVRRNVQALGGRIGIVSHLGRGSSFSLSLPLTLAVLDGMIVTVGDQTFVIPLSHIVENLRPKAGDINRMGSGCSLLNVRGEYFPVHHIGDQLGIAKAVTNPEHAVLIVVESDEGQAILMVDGIQDQRQIVVKSLEANYQAIDGLAGATILGDGRVALILDVDALIARWRRESRAGLIHQDLAA